MKSHIAVAFLLAVIGAASSQQAGRCDPSFCRLPTCSCGGTEVPGGHSRKNIPQFVLLTFDDAVNSLNQQFFKDLFANRKNPNGCPLKSTFYVSHEWTDYSQVQDLYADGHEMASHTVTHSDGKSFDEAKWASEVIGQAEMLVRYGGVRPEDIKGMRAPFLQTGGDSMFSALRRYGLYYDSSMSTTSPSWPYTLEYAMPHSCLLDLALPAPTLVCGKFLCPLLRMYVEAHVLWLMAVTMKKTKNQSRRSSPRTFWIATLKTRHHFPCFSIQLGSSTDLTVPKPFSLSSIQFSLCLMFILLPAKN